jgi:hypothetical protein
MPSYNAGTKRTPEPNRSLRRGQDSFSSGDYPANLSVFQATPVPEPEEPEEKVARNTLPVPL